MTLLRLGAAVLLLAGCGADTAPTDAEVREPKMSADGAEADSMDLAPIMPDGAPAERTR